MKINKSFTAMLLTGFLCTGLMAQAQEGHREARKEMQAYVQENVLPVMQAQRGKLDPLLSAQEQAELTAIRTEMKSLHKERQALSPKRSDRSETPKTGQGPSEAERAAFQTLRERREQITERARPILQAHEADISGLLNEVATERQQWRTDMRAIMASHLGEMPRSGKYGQGNKPGRAMAGMGHMHQPMGFLLWD